MKRADAAFLVGGLLYGIVLGFGGAFAVAHRPDLDALGEADAGRAAAPSGPPAPTMPSQGGSADGGAPAMARIRELKARLDEAPDDVSALLEMADLYHRVSMWDPSETYYRRAIEADPALLNARIGLGNMLHDAGRFDDAAQVYDEAMSLRPGDPDLLTARGICEWRAGRTDDAMATFEEAQQGSPGHLESLFRIATLADSLGDLERARSALDRLAAAQPGSPEVEGLRRQILGPARE